MSKPPPSPTSARSFFHLPFRRPSNSGSAESLSRKENEAPGPDVTGEAENAVPSNSLKEVVGGESRGGSSRRGFFHLPNLRTSNRSQSSTDPKEAEPTPVPEEAESKDVLRDESSGGTPRRSFFHLPHLRPSSRSIEEAKAPNDHEATPEASPESKDSLSTNDSILAADKSCNRRFFRLPGIRPLHRSQSPSKHEAVSERSADGESGILAPSSEKQLVVSDESHDPQNSESPDSKSSSSLSRAESPKRSRRFRPRRFIRRVANTVGTNAILLATQMEDLFFPRSPPASVHRVRVNNGVLLINCQTEEEHEKAVEELLDRVKDCNGEEGLRIAGFEYRTVYCNVHEKQCEKISDNNTSSKGETRSDDPITPEMETEVAEDGPISEASFEENISSSEPIVESLDSPPEATDEAEDRVERDVPLCSKCTTRLFHIESNTLITEENRRQFIADGDMYEEMARLCQDYAHSMMMREGELQWETICDDETYEEPVRALIHRDHHISTGASGRPGRDGNISGDVEVEDAEPKPTLLIVTGKGKVRAGIFSRQHLMVSGLEPSTALPTVREALQRNMNIVVLDPNARGDREGMVTFEKSLGELFRHWEDGEVANGSQTKYEHELYVLAHSASGAQLVRYLQDKEQYYLPRIRAIAFTDSTHNIQWTRDNASLTNLLQSSACVYVRSSNVMRDSNWENHKAGETVQTDPFWNRRFGRIRTMWAGTKEHSLTNWAAHSHIWDHFDRHLHTGTYFSNFSWANLSRHLRRDNEDEMDEVMTNLSKHIIEIGEENNNELSQYLATSSKHQDDEKDVATPDKQLNTLSEHRCQDNDGEKKAPDVSTSNSTVGHGVPVGALTV